MKTHKLLDKNCRKRFFTTGLKNSKAHQAFLSVVSKTVYKCQLSVKILGICQLSVNPI